MTRSHQRTVFAALTPILLVIAGQGAVASATPAPSGGPVALASEADLTINGFSALSAGESVASAGDVNGDGRDDVIIGSPTRAWVVYGTASRTTVNLASLGSAGFTITGGAFSVSSAGDVNGDGFADVIIGAATANSQTGRVYVIYGGASPSDVNVTNLNGAGFEIDGAVPNDEFGGTVAAAGDVNGDGLADVIIGAAGTGGMATGRAVVVYGARTRGATPLNSAALGSAGFEIHGAANGDFAGISAASAGDVNGDGLGDLIVGAANAHSGAGSAYVIYGSGSPGAVNLGSLGAAGFEIDGVGSNNLGLSVAAAGDVNGDGRSDVIIGSNGAAYVVYGAPSPTTMSVAALGTHGFTIDALGEGSFAGNVVDGAGDVNGDGRDDVIVGAQSAGAGGAGRAFVVYGSASPPAVVALASLGTAGFEMDGPSASLAGGSVAGAGDFDGDGLGDVIVSAEGAGGSNGAAYLIDGFASGPVATATPGIGGVRQVGSTLTATDGIWENAGTLMFTHQWRRCSAAGVACTAIAGATAATYPLGAADLGARLQLLVTATNSKGRSTVRASVPTAIVQPAPAPAVIAVVPVVLPEPAPPAPVISGSARYGARLTCTTTGWPAGVAVAWLRDAKVVSAGSTYRVVLADVEHALSCSASAGGFVESSTPVGVARVLPKKTKAPTITRKANTLTCNTGRWSGSTKLRRQWQRDGEPIRGATKKTYKLRSTDRHHRIACLVTASNPMGKATARTVAKLIR